MNRLISINGNEIETEKHFYYTVVFESFNAQVLNTDSDNIRILHYIDNPMSFNIRKQRSTSGGLFKPFKI